MIGFIDSWLLGQAPVLPRFLDEIRSDLLADFLMEGLYPSGMPSSDRESANEFRIRSTIFTPTNAGVKNQFANDKILTKNEKRKPLTKPSDFEAPRGGCFEIHSLSDLKENVNE